MGGVAHHGGGGVAGGDVGAGSGREADGGDDSVAWLRRAPEEKSATGSSRWSSREQCRRESCKEKVKSLKAEIKELKGELVPLKTRFAVDIKTAVAGQTRAVHAELAQLKISVEAKERAWGQACDHRKRSEKTAREFSVENSRLLVMVAEAKASYATLIGKHASSEKKAQSEIRQAAQRERQLKIRLMNVTKAAEAKVDAAEAKADAATEAEACNWTTNRAWTRVLKRL